MSDAESRDTPAEAYLACPVARTMTRRPSGASGADSARCSALLRRPDVFGSKDWFVLEGDAAWYVQERAGIGYPRNVVIAGNRLAGWSVPAERAAGALSAMAAAARALKAECMARGLDWQEVARRDVLLTSFRILRTLNG